MKLSAAESAWLRILGVLTLVIVGIFFVQPILPTATPEPLADKAILDLLAQGKVAPVPPDETQGEFHGTKAIPPLTASLKNTTLAKILGTSDSNKRIEVDLTHQRVYAFEGDRKVYEFVVSTGKWYHTPTGTFTIAAKVRSQKMSGGNSALGTYYYLPNVPYVMFFGNSQIPWSRGFSLHGTYWHSNFGHPMSHGCVNMKTEDAKVLFEWSDPQVGSSWSTTAPGTPVIIYGTTPRE